MPDQNYTPATQGATVPETSPLTVAVPVHFSSYQDMQDFSEAVGLLADMQYCLDLFNAGLAAGKTPDEMQKEWGL